MESADRRRIVRLTPEDRAELTRMVRSGTRPSQALIRARILLKADTAADGPGWDDRDIAEAVECGERTVGRVRQKYAEGGLAAAVFRRKPTGRQYRQLTGEQEARLVALACSPVPEGKARWTLKLLADKLVELEVIDAVSDETVRRTLKKTR